MPALWTTAFPEQVKKDHRNRIDARRRRYLCRSSVWKLENPLCACCVIVNPILHPKKQFQPKPRRTASIHHWAGRDIVRQGTAELDLLLYEPYWIPACSICHDWIHKEIARARSKGLIAPMGEWNAYPRT